MSPQRRLALALLTLALSSCSADEAGVVLNVDAQADSERALINRLVVTVDGRRQEWLLALPLPGSLGIETSPGTKMIVVDGYATNALRGRWASTVVAKRGKVIVLDVHLAPVGLPVTDAGQPDARADGPAPDLGFTRDVVIDTSGRDVARGADAGGAGGQSGTDASLPTWDGGAGGLPGTGGRSDGGGDAPGTGGAPTRDGGDAPATDGGAGADAPLSTDLPPLPAAPLTGDFQVISPFEIPASAAAPGPVGDTLELVHGFVVDPGEAILDFAGDAGIPGLGTLRSVLPDSLESRLTGWMNDYIKSASVGGVTPYDQLVWLDDTIRALLLYWTLQSRLALPAGATGTHAPVTLVFASTTGSPFTIPVDPTARVTSGIGVTASLNWPEGAAGPAVVSISDHFLGLPFGRYVLEALSAVLRAEHGAPDLATYLSNAVGCPGLADYVSSQCISVLCVGHESDLLEVCQGGLAEGARQIEDQIRSLDFKAIHFQQGTAIAVGAQVDRPQGTTALASGVWSATVDFGSGPAPATATFSATVEAESP